MIRYLKLSLLLFTLSFAGYAQNTTEDKITIFPKEKVIGNNSPTSRFTPSMEEVQEADAIVQAYLKEKYPGEMIKVDDYFRQYYGTILAGQHIINVIGCCKKPDKFSQEVYTVKGGGSCYFNGPVNMKAKKVMAGFKLNGAK